MSKSRSKIRNLDRQTAIKAEVTKPPCEACGSEEHGAYALERDVFLCSADLDAAVDSFVKTGEQPRSSALYAALKKVRSTTPLH